MYINLTDMIVQLEMAGYKDIQRFIEKDKINEDCCVFSLGKDREGLVGYGSKMILPPIFSDIKRASDEIVLVKTPLNTYGVYDVSKQKYLTNCAYDYVQLVLFNSVNEKDEFVDVVEYIDLYKGVNSYTIDMNDKDKKVYLNPYISDHMLEVLRNNPKLFAEIDSVYFKEVDSNKYNKGNARDFIKAACIGQKRLADEMKLQGKSSEEITATKSELYFGMVNKIKEEKAKFPAENKKEKDL